MSDETTVVAAGDQTEEVKPVNPEVSAVAEPEKVGDEEAPQGTPKEGESEEQRSKRKGGWQRRIEKLEREKEALQDLLLARSPKEEKQEDAKPKKFAVSDPEDPMPDLDSFSGTLKEFNAELAAWSVRQAKREFSAEQAKKEQESSQKAQERKWNEAQSAFSEAHDDYEEVSDSAVDAIRAIEGQPGIQAIAAATTDPELGPALLYHLGQNQAEIKRLAALSPIRAAMELGKLTSALAHQESKPETKKAPAVSKAPAPAKPVSKPSAAPKPFDPNDPANDSAMSGEEWMKARNKQVAERK